MRPVSSRWVATIPASHTVSVAVTVIEPDGTETPLNGNVTAGAVTLDGKADTRGAASLTIVDESLIPIDPSDLLAPYSNEVRIERGYTTPDGYTERVSVVVIRIEDSNVERAPGALTISLSGRDRSARFVDATFEEGFSIAAGANYVDAILSLLQGVWPEVPYDFTATDKVTPILSFAEGDSVWAAATGIATYLGLVLYFDGDGTCILKPYAPGSAVATISEDVNLLNVSRSWTRQGAFNRVVTTGENSTETAVYRSVAIDDDPLSPTYFYGPFGKISKTYSTPYIISQIQADDAAASILAQGMGTTQQINFGSFVDASLEPIDVVRVEETKLGLSSELIIDNLTIPLTADGTMDATTRAVQVQ